MTRTKRPRATPRVAGADMGCADTWTMHSGSTLTLPDHETSLERTLEAQRELERLVSHESDAEAGIQRTRFQLRPVRG